MELEYTEEQEEFRQELRDWLVNNLPEGWLEGDRKALRDPDRRIGFLQDWQHKLFDGGWAGIHWPTEYGGRGASLMEQVIYDQETAKVDAPPILNSLGIDLVGPTLMEVGTDYQKERFLPKILSGEEIWCQGYSEPNAGSDLASLQTEAIENNGQFVINGQKIWTSYAQHADWCFTLTRTDDSGDKHHGITALIVDMKQEAVTTEPINQINGKSEFNQVYFDDAVAERKHMIGEKDEGWEAAMVLSAYEHTTSYTFKLERRFEELVEYCQTNARNGAPLIEDSVIRRRLAKLYTKVQAAKLTHLRNVSSHMTTGSPAPEGSMDRVYSTELKQELEDFATNVLGANSALWEDSVDGGSWITEYLYSFSRTIAGGSSDIQRNIIGERVLDLPRGFRE
jgi:alkylation response protein AidB-like acyl-CoA dehydrogenase